MNEERIKTGRDRIAEDLAKHEADRTIIAARIRVNKRLRSLNLAPEGTDEFIKGLEKDLAVVEVILDEYYQIVNELESVEAQKQETQKQKIEAASPNGVEEK